MSEHTKEPEVIANLVSLGVGFTDDSGNVFIHTAPAWLSRRIVACVNACVGISNDELEEISSAGGMLTPRQQIADIAKQRDELLAALKESRLSLELAAQADDGPIVDTIWHTATETLFDFMDAAIAKAEAAS